ncbi:blue light receptor [Aspergillus nanangensis]|uniref:Blue light receptor n=1 Tax=Aspergillus nanangensis TaxID=2582783 RepID=A0AAD4CIF2_ASPNN|nr:blue light receptor [Aspergillus nanangensis]
MEGFSEGFYDPNYALHAPPDRHLSHSAHSQSSDDHHNAQMMPFSVSDHLQTGNYAYQPQEHEMLAASAAFMMPSHTAEFPMQSTGPLTEPATIGGRGPNLTFAYDPLSVTGSSMPMGMGSTNSFAYDAATFPSSNVSLHHGLDQHHGHQRPTLQSQQMGLDPSPGYSVPQATPSFSSVYWGATSNNEVPRTQQPGMAHRPADTSQPTDPALSRRQPPELQTFPQPPAPSFPHRYIQPKTSSALKGSFPSLSNNSEARGEETQFTSIYSSSGFDIMRVLAEVVSRPNPKINIGAVDLSCAFVLCDITKEDHPIVYVSEPFERLTGYTEDEILGQNCRFLQGPDGVVHQGMSRTFVDQNTAFRLRSTIEERTEIQASIINYRKGGQPFMNLITMIPIRWNSNDYRFYVGFQVDLVEKPDAVTRRNPNGTYMINYQRSKLPQYVVPPEEIYRMRPDLAIRFNPTEVSIILENVNGPDPIYRAYLDRVLADNTDDVIHVLSYECELLYLSPSCRTTLEYDSTELVGKTLSTVCHPSDIGPVTRDLRACTSTDPVSVLYRIRRKNSGYVWFESRGSWHIGDRGRQYMVLIGRVRSVYCLDQIAKIGRGALAETDIWAKVSLSGIILFMSSKSRPVLGRVPDDLVGKGLQELVDSRPEVQQALESARMGRETSFRHRIRHKKGHMLPVKTTLFPGDTKEGIKPTFLVAQLCFPRTPQDTPSSDDPTSSDTSRSIFTGGNRSSGSTESSVGTQPGALDISSMTGSSRLPSGNQYVPTIREPPTLFTELLPTRGSSWQFELRELEKQNRVLSDELQRLLTRRKKRKRKQSSALVEKICAMCRTRKTPEWRRGPSGNRDLCNSCGLRWAKQLRNAAQSVERPNS